MFFYLMNVDIAIFVLRHTLKKDASPQEVRQ